MSLDSVTFLTKVHLGEVLLLRGRLNAAFGSSMEVEVQVHSENPLTGERRLTTTAFVTMVAVDPQGRPASVPLLVAENDDERRGPGCLRRRRGRLASRTKPEGSDLGGIGSTTNSSAQSLVGSRKSATLRASRLLAGPS